MVDLTDSGSSYPRPIAWALSEVNRARGPVDRFHRWVESAEQATSYLALVALARYLEVRCAAVEKTADPALEQELLRLRRPTFGDWVECLARLDGHLCGLGELPLGAGLSQRVDGPAMLALANLQTNRNQRRVAIIGLLRHLVTLRNRTKHGGVSEKEARDLTEPLGSALLELLASLPVLTTRPPVFVRSIEKRGRGRFVVEYLQLTGTGRPPAKQRDVPDPGILDPEVIYLWGDKGDAPLQMTPLLHFHPEHDAVCMLCGFPAGVPEYRSAEHADLSHGPDKLMSEFEARASFLLGAPEPTATSTSRLLKKAPAVK